MSLIVTTLLLVSSITAGLGSQILFGANYTPPVGTTYAELAGSNNSFTFNCDQFRQDTSGNVVQSTTVWTLENFEGFSGRTFITDILHPEFVINGTERDQLLPFPTFRNTLTIVNHTQRLHNVTLFCGQADELRDGTWNLRVYTVPVLDSIQVTIVEGMSLSVDLSEGNIEAFPYPSQFQWTKDGAATSNTSRVMYGYPSLVFDLVCRDDLGNYTLSATNSRLGDPQRIIGTGSGEFSLNVLYGPEIEEEDPSFVAVENDNVTLICGTMLVGNPSPVIEWTDNEGNVISTNSNKYIFNNGPDVVSLVIIDTELIDSGNWTCRLITSETGGEVQRILTLTVIGAPSKPVNVTIENTGPTWTTISWGSPTNPGTPSFSNFTITATPLTGETVSTTIGKEFNVNLTGLFPGLQYGVTVVAMTVLQGVYASSNNSIQVFATTNTSVPDISCENSPVSVNGIITVDWRYPHTGGLNLTSVVVVYATPDSGFQILDNGEITPQNISQQTTLAVHGFIAGIFYTFRITATNDVGSSSALCPPVFHSTGIPQTPNIMRGISNAPQQVTLTVSTAESGIEPSNAFFEFVVLVKDENVTIPEFLVPIDYTGLKDNEIVDLRVSSEQLLAEEMYIFQVQARNAFGTTPFSNSLSVRVTTQNTEEQALPIGAIAGGGAAVVVVIILLIFVILLVLVILKKKSGDNTKLERSNSLEMVTNYGKTKMYMDGETAGEPPQYEAIPVHISRPGSQRSVYDQLGPTAKESDNPLYSSTGELRMSAVFSTYDVVPGRSREHSRNPSPSLSARGYSFSHSPRAALNGSSSPQQFYSSPTHNRTSSSPAYSTPAAVRAGMSPLPLPEGPIVNGEPLYAQADPVPGRSSQINGHPIITSPSEKDPVYTEL